MTFGEYLKQLMDSKGYTLKSLAQTLEISEVGLRNYLNDTFVPTSAKIGKIANLLDVDFDMLYSLAETQRLKNKNK